MFICAKPIVGLREFRENLFERGGARDDFTDENSGANEGSDEMFCGVWAGRICGVGREQRECFGGAMAVHFSSRNSACFLGDFESLGAITADDEAQSSGAAHFAQVIDRARSDEFAAGDHESSGARCFDFGQNVGAQKNGVFVAASPNEVPDLADLVRIHACSGFVQDENRWISEESIGEAHALSEAFGQVPNQDFADFEDIDFFRDGFDGTGAFFAGQTFQFRPKSKVFADAHFGVQRTGFGHVTQFLPRKDGFVRDVVTIDADAACRRSQKSCKHAQGGAFPRAVRSEKSDDFATFDMKRNVTYGAK